MRNTSPDLPLHMGLGDITLSVWIHGEEILGYPRRKIEEPIMVDWPAGDVKPKAWMQDMP